MDAKFEVEALDLAGVFVFLDAGASESDATKPSSETYSEEMGAAFPEALVRLVPAMIVIVQSDECKHKADYCECKISRNASEYVQASRRVENLKASDNNPSKDGREGSVSQDGGEGEWDSAFEDCCVGAEKAC